MGKEFDNRKENLKVLCDMDKKRLEEYKVKYEEAVSTNNERIALRIEKLINDTLSHLDYHLDLLKYIRESTEEDTFERTYLRIKFNNEVKESIPDDIPIVFHGNDKIGTVKKIIESGGLFTPEERNVDFSSFASQIDAAYKNNISACLEFAEPGIKTNQPFGAIFVFTPSDDEVDKVLKTGDNSEVYNGVKSVNFKENPERLIAIITTNENINRIQEWCEANNIDENKVCNHVTFIQNIKKLYPKDEEKKVK